MNWSSHRLFFPSYSPTSCDSIYTSYRDDILNTLSEIMNEITALISYACKVAMELDSNLPHLVNRQDVLLGQVEGIIRLFSSARDHLLSLGSMRVGHDPYQTAMEMLPSGVGEKVRDVVASSDDSKKEVCGHDMEVVVISQGSVEAQADTVEHAGEVMSSARQRTRWRGSALDGNAMATPS
ncbi:hypothetical protein Drorol1_Dr00015967 [Drosera rotundifolia]